jgi:uncharacterized protein with FMN-binding domain
MPSEIESTEDVMKNRTRKRMAAAAAASAIGLMVSGAAGAQAKAVNTAAASGTFTGRREYAYYGWVRIAAVVRNGTISTIRVLEFPNDNGRSQYINSVALPYLIQETVGGRTWKVDLISGATFTSVAYQKSLKEALAQAGL